MYPENDYRNYLEHSAKGTHWKKGHKYIAIKNGKYIYPEDVKRSSGPVQANYVYEKPGEVNGRPRGHARKIDYDNLWSVEKGNALGRKKKVGNQKLFSGKGSGNYKTSLDMDRINKSSAEDLKINGKATNSRKKKYMTGKTRVINRVKSALGRSL